MPTGLFDSAREAFLAGDLSWRDDDIRAILIDAADYAVDLASHNFLDDVAAGARVSTSGSFTGKTIAAGVADANDLTFSLVSGDPVEAVLIYCHDGGADSARRLIAYIDTAVGLPVIPNGLNITLAWSNGANRIFKL